MILRNETILVVDPVSGVEILTTPQLPWHAHGTFDTHAIADVDADGVDDILLSEEDNSDASHTLVGLDGVERWTFSAPATDGRTAVAAQLDGDPQLEVVVGTRILDGLSGLEQGQLHGVGQIGPSDDTHTRAADTDGDGLDEILRFTGVDWELWDPTLDALRWSFDATARFVRAEFADADNDGRAEVVIADGVSGRDGLRVLDGQTGVVRHTVDADLWCSLLTVMRPAAGAPMLMCRNELFLRLRGWFADGRQWTSGIEQYVHRVAADLDHDGVTELVEMGGTVSVLDDRGRPYGGPTTRGAIHVVDWDGDGTSEIVTSDRNGLHGWDWSPTGGFVQTALLLPTQRVMAELHITDLNGDGNRDLLYRWQGCLHRLDLGTGADRSIRCLPGYVSFGYADLQGDGLLEVWDTTATTVSIFDGNGLLIADVAGIALGTVSTPMGERLMVYDEGEVHLVGLLPTGLTTMDSLTPPDLQVDVPVVGTILWERGRLWYPTSYGAVGWDPITGDEWRMNTQIRATQLVLQDDVLWLGTRTASERWLLP